MFKKTLLATAAAGMIAVGTLATAGAASAAPNGPHGGPNWTFQFNAGPQFHPQQFHPKKVCQPVFRSVKWWDRFGRPHWKQVSVGQKCFFVKPHHNGNGPNFDGGHNYPGPF